MRLWISILILSILSSFALGWYASSLYFQKGESIGIIGNVISVISPIVGGGVAALKMFLEWYNKPTLSYGDIFKQPEERITGFSLIEHWQRRPKIEPYTSYNLRIRKTGGKGRVEDCKGYITIEGTYISVSSVWQGAGDYGGRSIDNEDDFKLFNVSQDQKSLIIFSNPNNIDKSSETHHPYTEEILDKELSVTIASSNAKVPQQPYTKTIREIIETAKSI